VTPEFLTLAAAATGIVFLAAVLRGFTGFSFALASVPMLGLAMQPARAVPLSLVIVTLGGLFGTRRAFPVCDWRSVKGLALGAAIGSPIGAVVLKYISADAARVAISLFTLAAVFSVGRSGAPQGERPGAHIFGYGLLAGLFNGLAAMPGPPVVAYFMASPLNREAVRASLLVIFQFTAMVGVVSAAALGLIDRETLLLTLCALPAFWIGNSIGLHFFSKGSEAGYRRIVLACLALMALGSAVPAVRGIMAAPAVATAR